MPDGKADSDEDDTSPSKASYTGGTVAEIDPMVHVVESVVADRKEQG